MELLVDSDLKAVIEFMQGHLPAAKLVAVANAVAKIAPALWGHFEAEDIAALRLVSVNAPRAAHTRPCAKSLAPAGDADGDFAAAAS